MTDIQWLDSLESNQHEIVMEMLADFEKLGVSREAALHFIREQME